VRRAGCETGESGEAHAQLAADRVDALLVIEQREDRGFLGRQDLLVGRRGAYGLDHGGDDTGGLPMPVTSGSPGFNRLSVDERRRLLLERGRALFTSRPYDELSMAAIAKDAGISKALLYHYFPSKQAYFVATLQDGARELADRVRPLETDPPRAQLESALEAWLSWVDANRESYGKLMRAAHAAAEVRELIDGVRDATAALIAARLLNGALAAPAVRSAVNGWLWFMDGVCLDWVRHSDLERDHVRALLLDALPALLAAAGQPDVADRLR
jgi:AcrR family transcriptional regulator